MRKQAGADSAAAAAVAIAAYTDVGTAAVGEMYVEMKSARGSAGARGADAVRLTAISMQFAVAVAAQIKY